MGLRTCSHYYLLSLHPIDMAANKEVSHAFYQLKVKHLPCLVIIEQYDRDANLLSHET